MSQPLAPLVAKLDRADESLHSLDDEMRAISNGEPSTILTELDFKTGWHTVEIVHVEPVPPRPSVLVGESLYHGRSVLEHLVWALVKANDKTPGKDHTFPLWDKPPCLKGVSDTKDAFIGITKRKQLAGVPETAIALIEGLQPYRRPEPARSFLSILNNMARDDRHHAIHSSFVGSRPVTDMQSWFRVPRGVHFTEFQPLLREGQRVVADTKIARFRLSKHGRYPQVQMEGRLPIFVAFGSDAARMVVVGDFQQINTQLRGIIEPFAEFL